LSPSRSASVNKYMKHRVKGPPRDRVSVIVIVHDVMITNLLEWSVNLPFVLRNGIECERISQVATRTGRDEDTHGAVRGRVGTVVARARGLTRTYVPLPSTTAVVYGAMLIDNGTRTGVSILCVSVPRCSAVRVKVYLREVRWTTDRWRAQGEDA